MNNTFGLSKTEIEVVKQLCAVGANKLIGTALGITESTVKVHMRMILRKLGIKNRALLACWAVRNGMDL